MSLTDSLAQSIATMEGFFNSTPNPSQTNNNPGNLRAGVSQVGTDANGLAIFASVQDGWTALYHQIALDASRGLNLSQFIAKYAPPSENNTSNYLSFVTGIPPFPETQNYVSKIMAAVGLSLPDPPTAPPHRRMSAGPIQHRPSEAAD